MGLEDLVNKGKELFEENKDKVEELLKSDKAEEISDAVLDKGEELANKVTGGAHADTVKNVRDQVDGAVGNQ